MTDRPILFSAPMIRALLAGVKTVTRRIVKLPPAPTHRGGWDPTTVGGHGVVDAHGSPVPEHAAIWNQTSGKIIVCPYGSRGDRLWVKETHALIWPGGDGPPDDVRDHAIEYRADTDGVCRPGEWPLGEPGSPKWKPSIFMPRWASRITLDVTEVRVERLHAITEADARAEGCTGMPHFVDVTPREEFEQLWRGINGEESWDENPWVWVVAFGMVRS